MGYTIRIGNAEAADVEEGTDRVQVKVIELDAAPSFHNDAAGKTNTRMPSYVAWERFTSATGLRDLFLRPLSGLLSRQPACAILTHDHLAEVQQAVERYRSRNPDATPTFDARLIDEHWARLLWLEWWMSWALANCERPVFENC